MIDEYCTILCYFRKHKPVNPKNQRKKSTKTILVALLTVLLTNANLNYIPLHSGCRKVMSASCTKWIDFRAIEKPFKAIQRSIFTPLFSSTSPLWHHLSTQQAELIGLSNIHSMKHGRKQKVISQRHKGKPHKIHIKHVPRRKKIFIQVNAVSRRRRKTVESWM